ncbi:hypothetical protein [Sphingomonas aracearum]|uniref:Uncharacterized protein n=1 Tax=Sphingomonas aracearum TaxID=2283317 RepID=A0A369VRG6_9SPHN|nr:hypothetical protein [Sphingomonas aracearum]RDE04976.1 hypothetical protein DVW87_15580 [Sphingomonas aracearum]
MAEATWGGDSQNPAIDWKMSAALENVVRQQVEVPEVTNLEKAVRAWIALDPTHRQHAVLTPERPVTIDGTMHDSLTADGIALLASKLPQ